MILKITFLPSDRDQIDRRSQKKWSVTYSMIIIFSQAEKNRFFLWLARPKNLPYNQKVEERVKKYSRLIFTARGIIITLQK